MSFQVLGLNPKILQAVTEAGYTEPTPIQSATIPPIIAGHDLIGIAQTGTGKTAAFTLPMLTKLAAAQAAAGPNRRTRVLILAPTRELVVQIEENIRAYAKHLPLTIATVFGGVGEQPQIRALRSNTDIVVACPGRLLDLLGRRTVIFPASNFSCSTKLTACWTWVFFRPSGKSSVSFRSNGRRSCFPPRSRKRLKRSRMNFNAHRKSFKSVAAPIRLKPSRNLFTKCRSI